MFVDDLGNSLVSKELGLGLGSSTMRAATLLGLIVGNAAGHGNMNYPVTW